MKQKKLFAIFAAILVLTTLLAACGGSGNSNTADSPASPVSSTTEPADTEVPETSGPKWSVTIPGMNGSLCNIPTFIAYEQGYFAEEGLDVTLVSADYEAKKVGLNNGTMPVVNGDFMYFPSIEADLNITVVDGMHKGCIKLQVLPDSEIASPEDLRGLTIACDEIGGTPYQVVSLWLEQNGLKAIGADADVTFLPYSDDPLALQALYNGEVAAAAVWDPMASIAESEGSVKTIFDISADEPFASHYCCFLYASTKVLDEDPEQVAAIMRAYRKAEDFIANNVEEATDIIIDRNYVSIEDRDLAVRLVASYGYPSTEDFENNRALDAAGDVAYFAEALNSIGYLQSDPTQFTAKGFTAVDFK